MTSKEIGPCGRDIWVEILMGTFNQLPAVICADEIGTILFNKH